MLHLHCTDQNLIGLIMRYVLTLASWARVGALPRPPIIFWFFSIYEMFHIPAYFQQPAL
jgi:hypothetical protein